MNRLVVADALAWVAVTITCSLIVRNSGDGSPFAKCCVHLLKMFTHDFMISYANIFSLIFIF